MQHVIEQDPFIPFLYVEPKILLSSEPWDPV